MRSDVFRPLMVFSVPCVLLLAGCGGGAGVGSPPVTLAPQSAARVSSAGSTAKPGTGRVTLAFLITPKKTASAIRPQYISPATASITVLTDGANPATLTVSPPGTNCAPRFGGLAVH